eukprot:CAMPEP_0172500850 /NCGR_PEP_ID=MMETSP1066-20121228/143948_1 /TAXON_ID=671091 /ORGANISM="Coscinodiscus wailesii, Strain CCMP2513" /LENGTH=365 /DNA_ID=CAMNT_0013275331 /DNA_START=229 /DNA_END=1322 /DNA_ORIENTATION=+
MNSPTSSSSSPALTASPSRLETDSFIPPPPAPPVVTSPLSRSPSSASISSTSTTTTPRRRERVDSAGNYVRVDTVTRDKKIVLRPMSVSFPEGEITGILGSRDCGKTTLLHFAMGRFVVGDDGRGLALGDAITYSSVNLLGTKAFVPSHPKLHNFYTVLSHMQHYSRLTSDKLSLTPAQNDRIDALLTTLSFYDIRHKPVSQLSPTQRTTLAVALESLSSPDTLFLHNPRLSIPLLQFLQKYVSHSSSSSSAQRRRVVMSLDDPVTSFQFRFFHNVILLSRGYLMYVGPRKRMEGFFAANGFRTPLETNPADHYVRTVEEGLSLHHRRGRDDDDNRTLLKDWMENFEDWRGSGGGSRGKRLSDVR